MPETLTLSETESEKLQRRFNPEANQWSIPSLISETSLKDYKDQVNAIARYTLNQGRRDLFGAEVSELYIKILERANASSRTKTEQKQIKKFLANLDNHIDKKLSPYNESFEFRKEGILAEYATMRLFQKHLNKNVLMDSSLDTSYKIDFQVEASPNATLLVQVKANNNLKDTLLSMGKNTPNLTEDARDELKKIIRPNKTFSLSNILDDQEMNKIFIYASAQSKDKNYIPTIIAFPSSDAYDEFGEPTPAFVKDFSNKLPQAITRYKSQLQK